MRTRAALALLATTAPALTQTIDDYRQDVRTQLAQVKFAKALSTLVVTSEELSLSSATFSFDDREDTELETFTLPFQRSVDLFGAAGPDTHVEGVLGYARTTQRADDAYDGQLPGLETSVAAAWTSTSAVLGVGPEFALGEDVTFTPLLLAGLARLESDATYAGPGAPLTAALLDGIAFNWDATAWVAGAAAQLEWSRDLAPLQLQVRARYDARWVGILESDDPAQDFTTHAQVGTLRADLSGPTGWRALDGDVGWRAFSAYRGFSDGNLFGNRSLFELGCALELTGADSVPLVDGASLHGSVFAGDGVTGWTVGLGLLF